MVDCVGQKLGNYRLIKLLGKGGFADVYEGEHVYLKTPAAIKVLQIQPTDEAFDKFLAEARTIARLTHPNIVPVLEFGIENDMPFLVMGYASYGSLRQRHPFGSVLPAVTILPYVKQVAIALQYAHERKIIHRDVKPENMLLGQSQVLMLSDFGIATTAHSMHTLRAGRLERPRIWRPSSLMASLAWRVTSMHWAWWSMNGFVELRPLKVLL